MKKIRRKSEREVLTWHGEKEVPYFTFPSFEKLSEIVHGFSSRLGGVSEGCLSSMNLSFSRGDEPERVRENFRRMAESIGFSEENLVFSAHGSDVVMNMARGKVIYENGAFLTLDLEDIRAQLEGYALPRIFG